MYTVFCLTPSSSYRYKISLRGKGLRVGFQGFSKILVSIWGMVSIMGFDLSF